MTREQAIEWIKSLVETMHHETNGGLYPDPEYRDEVYEALDLAIKALKQEPKTGKWIVHPKGMYAHLVCNKCISRAPYDCRTNYCPTCGAKMNAESEDLPSVTSQKWIPVSERLPEDNENVLMTIRRMDGRHNDYPFVSVGYIGWNQQSWWCAHDGDCAENHVEVLAWMPLPEPYKAESEE